jgi:hypothetical protein
MSRFWRDIAIGVIGGTLGIVGSVLLLRFINEPVRVEQNSGRLEAVEVHLRGLLERVIRLEVRHEATPTPRHGHPTPSTPNP